MNKKDYKWVQKGMKKSAQSNISTLPNKCKGIMTGVKYQY
jgi:hypothetical protein